MIEVFSLDLGVYAIGIQRDYINSTSKYSSDPKHLWMPLSLFFLKIFQHICYKT